MKKASIFLADGFEDMEALATRDILLRGGMEVTTVSISDELLVTSAHGLQVFADTTLDEYLEESPQVDVMIFPGGMPGAMNLANCEPLMEEMNRHYDNGGTVAAICAAPALVFAHLEGIAGQAFTCYDGFENHLTPKKARFERKPCVVSDRIITGRGPGHSFDFARAILSRFEGESAASQVAQGMILPCE